MVDIERLLADHPLSTVLRRCGITVPDPGPGVRDEWRGYCPLPSHPVPTQPGRHNPSLAVHISGRMSGRWHCFACQTGGDVIAFVRAYAQVGFRDAARLIEPAGPSPAAPTPTCTCAPPPPTPTAISSGRPPPDRTATHRT
jgi:CHC2 zinc finger